MNKMTTTISDLWFNLVKGNTGAAEGRFNMESFKEIKIGDILEFKSSVKSHSIVKVQITGRYVYELFYDMSSSDGFRHILTTSEFNTFKNGPPVYHYIYPERNDEQYDIVVLNLRMID